MANAPRHLPVGPVLAATTSTQAVSTLGVLALAAVAPRAAAELDVNPALIGYQVGVTFLAASLSALMAGGIVRRYGAVRASQMSLLFICAGCLSSSAGTLPSLVAGAILMGTGYGFTNPAASQLLSRAPSSRGMNLIFSIKQTGVPVGGVLAGVLMPPLTVSLGWQWALGITAIGIAALAAVLELVRRAWDTERQPDAALLEAARSAILVIWKHKPLRWLAAASFLYSGAQLSLSGFLVTYLVSDVAMSLVAAGTILAITNAAGAAGRLFWGWLADRLGSGGKALMANGAMSVAFALATSTMAPTWPTWMVAAVAAAFGFCAMGWNGVYIAVIARQAPAGSIGIATGGSLMVTYAGSVVIPPAFSALHERLDMSYGAGFALLSLVTALGIACVYLVRRSALSMRAAESSASSDRPIPGNATAPAADLPGSSDFNERTTPMNWDRIQGNWKQLKGEMKTKWGKLTDDEFDMIGGQRDKLVGKIQERYGCAQDEAEKQVADWERNYDGTRH